MKINKLDDIGKETKSKKFTKPLRGVLGGRKLSISISERGPEIKLEKIYSVAKRVFLAFALIVGFVYTIPAAIVLLASKKPKEMKGLEVIDCQRLQNDSQRLQNVANNPNFIRMPRRSVMSQNPGMPGMQGMQGMLETGFNF